ncbi:methyltransferase, FxLD system [Streptomyces aidingensis]|uniref:Protein-L-isoaspartate O-methyltransferase n=1 Tax=Streptomyces aidingensis TaxID=910347 RepID=A0A1I1KPP5_9ACTN|nr:methyltransferase, FxLD system [Streptomyces aidingensis]SFC62739.1 protein-L-isoaspartate(D-aspartate) O-methyltransferase [Streptomyces aidingensis]
MGYRAQHEWDQHYRRGEGFRPLSEAEQQLLKEHLAPPEDCGGRALDVGCGTGELARYLVAVGYRVDAVDFAGAALAAARARGEAAGVRFLELDIERDDLGGLHEGGYDLVTMRLVYPFLTGRARVLRELGRRLRPGGALCVITPCAEGVPAHQRDIALDEEETTFLAAGWRQVMRLAADDLAVLILREPASDPVRAVEKDRPAPHALTGALAVVTDAHGRLLLGWSARGTWEMPGGKHAAGESFEAAAVRELAEEAGLVAETGDAKVLALVADDAHGIPRLTAVVRITAWSGTPAVREPELIHRWEWHDLADLPTLPGPLFTPAAHAINTVWPGLLPGLPPAHRYPHATSPAAVPGEPPAARRLRQRLADQLLEKEFIRSPAIGSALRVVPRHRFLPEAPLEKAYADDSVVTKRDDTGRPLSSVSAPWLQALMLHEAGLAPGHHALEIGSGGYNAALMAEITGPSGSVTTVDIDPYVTGRARRFLDEAGYHDVRVVLGDGEQGAPGHVPAGGFDAIIVTVEAPDIPPAWFDQLAEGGRLVLPLRVRGYSRSVTLEKHDGQLVSHAFHVCGFVPMQGAGRRRVTRRVLREGEITLSFEDGEPSDTSALEDALATERLEVPTGVTIASGVSFETLQLWLATTQPGFCTIGLDQDKDTGTISPPRYGGAAAVRDSTLAYLTYTPTGHDEDTGNKRFEFVVHAFGPHAPALAQALAERVRDWDRHHRHGPGPRLTVHPRASWTGEHTGPLTLKKHIVLAWDWPTTQATHTKDQKHTEPPKPADSAQRLTTGT